MTKQSKRIAPSVKYSENALRRMFWAPRHEDVSLAMTIVSYAVVILFVLVALLPFLYIILTAIKESKFLFDYPPKWLPKEIYLGNFEAVLSNNPFLRWTLNTLVVAFVVMVFKLLFDTMAGYAFAKLEFPGKNALFILILATLMIPFSAILIPLYFMIRGADLLNTYWALILPPLANPIGIFLMRGFIEALPSEIEKAARLDGASEFAIYRTIILPLVRPAMVVLGVLTFNLQYTSFLWPITVISSREMMVLTQGIASQRGITVIDWGIFSAGAVLSLVPITIFFLLLQKQWIASSLAGALKQ